MSIDNSDDLKKLLDSIAHETNSSNNVELDDIIKTLLNQTQNNSGGDLNKNDRLKKIIAIVSEVDFNDYKKN